MLPARFRTALIAALFTPLLFEACQQPDHPAEPKTTVTWKKVQSWSGHGDAQTDSFDIGFTQVRIRWETRNEKPAGSGKFHVTVNSAVSGRELATAVDYNGVGQNIAYISVEPHWSYLVINSSNVDWSVTVEEPSITQNP